MDRNTTARVRDRGGNRCEYCRLHQQHSPVARLQIEHIIPKKHGGDDRLENLALACIDCNLAKASNLSGIDPVTTKIVELFNPRLQTWADHFALEGTLLVGLTEVGRATVQVLNMNTEARRQVRFVALA